MVKLLENLFADMDFAILLLSLGDEEMKGYPELREKFFSQKQWEDRGEYYLNLDTQLSESWLRIHHQLIATASNFSTITGDNPFKSRTTLLDETIKRIYGVLEDMRKSKTESSKSDVEDKKDIKKSTSKDGKTIYPKTIYHDGSLRKIEYISEGVEDDIDPDNDIERGITTEPRIRQFYSDFHKKEAKICGIAIPKSLLCVGASADAEVENGIVEIKAPRKIPTPILKRVENKDKKGHSHIWNSHWVQMQSYMELLSKDWCDYLSYCHADRFLYMERIPRDKEEGKRILLLVRGFIDDVKKAVFSNPRCKKIILESLEEFCPRKTLLVASVGNSVRKSRFIEELSLSLKKKYGTPRNIISSSSTQSRGMAKIIAKILGLEVALDGDLSNLQSNAWYIVNPTLIKEYLEIEKVDPLEVFCVEP